MRSRHRRTRGGVPCHPPAPGAGLARLLRRDALKAWEYGAERLEAACARALAIAAPSFRSVHSILRHGLDRRPLPGEDATGSLPTAHENIRGADYYH